MFFRRMFVPIALSFYFVTKAVGQLTETGDTTAQITVRVTRPFVPQAIPSSVFGSFLEPIGKSTYGGLWADVIENPSFEEGLWSVETLTQTVP